MRIKKSYFCLIVLLLVYVSSLNAQETDSTRVRRDSLLNKITNIDARVKEISTKDTTKGFSAPLVIDTAYLNDIRSASIQPLRDENGLLLFTHEWTPFSENVSFRDTVIFEPAFLPVVFDGKILPTDLDLEKKDSLALSSESFHLVSPDSTFAPSLKRMEHIQNMRRIYYTNNPQKVRLNALEFRNIPVITQEVEKKNPFKDLITADNTVDISKPDIEKTGIKSIFWTKNGSHRLDLTQNSFSSHWPGENYFNLYSEHKFNINYRKGKVYWNNLIEWRLNIQRSKTGEGEDEKYEIRIADDLLRTYSILGITAFKNWSYTTTLEMKTPLFNKFDGEVRQRALLSPFESNLGVGMTYGKEIVSKVDKYRKFNININLQALSLNYKNVMNDAVNPGQFGIEEGHSSKLDYGSTYNLNMTYSRNRYTNFTSRIHYFTNYERVYAEWENTLNFKLNQYFSTSIYFYLKFDDSVGGRNQEKDRWARYFSYYQRLGFGLNYVW